MFPSFPHSLVLWFPLPSCLRLLNQPSLIFSPLLCNLLSTSFSPPPTPCYPSPSHSHPYSLPYPLPPSFLSSFFSPLLLPLTPSPPSSCCVGNEVNICVDGDRTRGHQAGPGGNAVFSVSMLCPHGRNTRVNTTMQLCTHSHEREYIHTQIHIHAVHCICTTQLTIPTHTHTRTVFPGTTTRVLIINNRHSIPG